MNGEYEVLDLSLRNLALYVVFLGVIVDGIVATLKSAIYLLTKSEKAEEFNPLNVFLPIIAGVVVVLIFGISPWSWLPFAPQHKVVDIALSSILISRGGNLSHDLYSMAVNLIGRISKNGSVG